MNAEKLLQLYDRVSDAPDAIPRLRRFILNLAVCGRLVEHSPHDEPASLLRERIINERDRLTKAGEFREPRNAVEIDRERLPFSVPARWSWVRLIDIASVNYGFAFASSRFNNEKRGMPLIRIRDISKSDTEAYYDGDFDSAYVVSNGDYLVGMDGDFNLRCWQGKQALLNQRVMRISDWKCEVCPVFIKLPLQFALDFLHSYTSQTTVKHLSAKQVNGIEIPLPPLAEQHRIAAKVDELMALCDRLETEREKREATRDRLNTASLSRLTAPDVDEKKFKAHARFAINVLPELTARPDQIKVLRQTILDLAVRGKLVEQDPNDEPAGEFLKKLTSDRAKAQKTIDLVTFIGASTLIPESWIWIPLGHLISKMDAGWSPQCESRSVENEKEWGVLKTTAVQALDFDARQNKRLPPKLRPRPEHEPSVGDILVTRAGPKNRVGVSCVVDIPCPRLMISDKLIRFRLLEGLSPYYVALALNAGYTFEKLEVAKSGMAVMQMNISQAKLSAVPIPLPPLAEQKRIVAKVDALLAQCGDLEQRLSSRRATTARLLEALLRRALEPLVSEAA